MNFPAFQFFLPGDSYSFRPKSKESGEWCKEGIRTKNLIMIAKWSLWLLNGWLFHLLLAHISVLVFCWNQFSRFQFFSLLKRKNRFESWIYANWLRMKYNQHWGFPFRNEIFNGCWNKWNKWQIWKWAIPKACLKSKATAFQSRFKAFLLSVNMNGTC